LAVAADGMSVSQYTVVPKILLYIATPLNAICNETKKIQIKLATTCNKNEQQDGKNNAEL
jgi:hypothetical protein